MLAAAGDLGLDPGLGERRRELGLDPLDVARGPRPRSSRSLLERLVLVRLEVAEGEIFQLGLELPDAEPVGERRVDLHRLLGDADLLVARHALQRAHVVEAVGQLDQHDADVVDHRQEHLAQALGLRCPSLESAWSTVGGPGDLAKLGDAVDQAGDTRGPNCFVDLLQGDARCPRRRRAAARPRSSRDRAASGQDDRDLDRVDDVRLAGLAADRRRGRRPRSRRPCGCSRGSPTGMYSVTFAGRRRSQASATAGIARPAGTDSSRFRFGDQKGRDNLVSRFARLCRRSCRHINCHLDVWRAGRVLKSLCNISRYVNVSAGTLCGSSQYTYRMAPRTDSEPLVVVALCRRQCHAQASPRSFRASRGILPSKGPSADGTDPSTSSG